MATEQAPVLEVHPDRHPEAFVAGLAFGLKLYVDGKPVPQQRPRFRVIQPKGGGKAFAQTYEEKAGVEWQEMVATQTRAQIPKLVVTGDGGDFTLPAEGRILMTIRFNIDKPVSYGKSVIHHYRKPDVDNLAKGVMDGLVKGRIIKDDSLVTDLLVYKRYSTFEHPQGVEIDMTVINDI